MSGIELKPGLKACIIHQVEESDLATSWRNDVPVLATPVLLWYAELACMQAISGTLAPSQMTLGFGHEMRHLAPTPNGWTIQIEARLREIDTKILSFDVRASDGAEIILSGVHTRAIIERERFLQRVKSKSDSSMAPSRQLCPTPAL